MGDIPHRLFLIGYFVRKSGLVAVGVMDLRAGRVYEKFFEQVAGDGPSVLENHGPRRVHVGEPPAGGGTAFTALVKMRTARGYAAITVALEGQIPTRDSFDRPFEEQWPYHAVADTVLAVSSELLAPMP